MSKTVIVFPGQASQYVGMGKDLYEASDTVKGYYRLASDLLGDDLAKISFEGPAETLKRTLFTQPAILVHSLAAVALLGDTLPKFAYAAGHSLGEYGALTICGALTPEEAITAVCTRARLMEEACQANPGTMAAILALPEDKLKDICDQASIVGVVTMANINSGAQVAISGDINAVEKACELAKEAGAKRAIMLEVGGAFHSPLMAPAGEGMAACLDQLKIKDATPPVVANVTAAPVRAAAEIKRLLVEQITAPVRWRDTMSFFAGEAIETMIEIGPGKVLTGLARREMPGVELINIDTLADVEKISANVE